MKLRITVIVLSAMAGICFSSLTARMLAGNTNAAGLVPLPRKMERRKGAFELRPEARILVDATSLETGEYLARRLRQSTGYPLPVARQAEAQAAKGDILLTTRGARTDLGGEGYELGVSSEGVIIRAPASAGLFYGAQSLLQLLPSQVFASRPVHTVKWTAPGVEIEDQPRFPWRGMLLDVSRHFFNKEEIKEFLDAMALHKLNTFHWHLTDDQGWRIEIKKYPRLTQAGAWRKSIGFKLDPKASAAYGPDGRYGGYYTQADVREIVAYARTRHITIVPEIEMPGHASAALAAYPEFSCSGGPFSTDAGAGVFAGVYCAGQDQTFAFLEDVLAEICELFPGKYIHIGGDEVPKQNWRDCPRCQARMRQERLKDERELQGYFTRRIGEFLNARGRTLIGWSEIREGGLAQNAVLMDWIGGATEAAGAGHDVVMSPNTHCYFDYYQSRDRSAEPRATAAFLPLEKVYSLEPIPADLDPQYQAHILGAQGNLWTEYIPSLKQAEYMTFPRLCALAEVVWSPKGARDWENFTSRLRIHCQRLDQLGINYRK